MADLPDPAALAREAIDRIYQDAKRAAQPHIDWLVKLEAMKPPAPLVIDPDSVAQRWTLDHRMMDDARPRPDQRRAAIERVTAQLEDAERHESWSAMINCADLRIIIEGQSE